MDYIILINKQNLCFSDHKNAYGRTRYCVFKKLVNVLRWSFWYVSTQYKLETIAIFSSKPIALGSYQLFLSWQQKEWGSLHTSNLFPRVKRILQLQNTGSEVWAMSGGDSGRRHGNTASPGPAGLWRSHEPSCPCDWLLSVPFLCFSLWRNENPFQHFKTKTTALKSNDCLPSCNVLSFSFLYKIHTMFIF